MTANPIPPAPGTSTVPPAPEGTARQAALLRWLRALSAPPGLAPDTLAPVSGDASFRRYYRIHAEVGTLIVMDAPPAQEDCGPFVRIAELLLRAGVRVPTIFAQDRAQGFLLLSDLGERTYYDAIQAGLAGADLQRHYHAALRTLVRMQQCPADSLPRYDETRLLQELALFDQWYLHVHHGCILDDAERRQLDEVLHQLVRAIATQPLVFVHRDFHSPNLMLAATAGDPPGVIDFQDALLGPLTYDIASLVMDARTTWDEPQQLDWAIRYWELARAAGLPVPGDFARFHQDYEWMGLQRNLRILGVFARLSHRDGKHGYLAHMPRVLGYVRQVVGRYRALRPLLPVLDRAEQLAQTSGYSF